MKRFRRTGFTALLIWCLVPAFSAMAAGTPAGTVISNTATATYDVGDVAGLTETSNPDTITVGELLDATLTWEDGGPIPVVPGDTDRILTFRLTNTGNGTDTYTLGSDNALAGDDFDPGNVKIYLDENGNGEYDEGTDSLYSTTNKPEIAYSQSRYIFVLNSIPDSPMPGDGDTGDSKLIATSVSAGTATPALAPGGVLAGGGEGGTDAVIGTSGGKTEDIGTYVVSNVIVSITKSSQILNDPVFGTQPVPGATIVYTIEVDVTGTGTAKNVKVTDTIPANTAYVDNTLQLDGADLSDSSGNDAGSVSGDPKTVTVNLGDLAEGDDTKTITFQVVIN